MKNKKVFFIPKNQDVHDCIKSPGSAKRYIPKWFKDMPAFLENKNNSGTSGTAKKCLPFTDSFLMGYIQELACDIEIKYDGYDSTTNEDIIKYSWSGNFRPLSTRSEEHNAKRVFPDFEGYYRAEFHWNTLWEPETPPGYSTLYVHPLNRFDLPFMTMNGIIDTDKWSITGPLPFLIKKGFEGIIPAGTPIYQTIFIKREVWNSEEKQYERKKQLTMEHNVRKFFSDGYRKMYWSKKEYN